MQENTTLKRLVADLPLAKHILHDLIAKSRSGGMRAALCLVYMSCAS